MRAPHRRVLAWTLGGLAFVSIPSFTVVRPPAQSSSPAPVRMKQVVAKLRGVASLITSARANIGTPPRVFVERAATMFHGASDLLTRDLLLAFADVPDTALQKELTLAVGVARRAIDAYATELETVVLQSATGSYAVGTANVEARYRAEELIDTPAATLLAIGGRELKK